MLLKNIGRKGAHMNCEGQFSHRDRSCKKMKIFEGQFGHMNSDCEKMNSRL